MKMPSPTELDLLDALGARERSGREVAQLYTKEQGKGISYGTLYSALRRLVETGWLETRDGEDEDGRIRYFKLTGPGIKALPHARQLNAIAPGEGVIV